MFHDGGTTTIDVDQATNRATWVLLGAYDLSPGGNPRVRLTNQADGRVILDAIRLVEQVTDETEFIVDNADPSISQTGTWGTYTTYDNGIYYDANYLTAAGGNGSNVFTWPTEVGSAGRYQVFARWTSNDNRSTAAEYTIHHAGGATVVHRNQKQNPRMWNSPGVYALAPSQNHRVTLSDADGERVSADAIRVVPVEYDTVPVYADAVRFVANDAEAVLAVHADQLGSPQKLTDLARSVVWDASFTPFGEPAGITGPANDNQRFPGQYYDAESGFHYNYFRDYDPALGRYIQADPIGLAGGLNVYAYARSNPITATDRWGLFDPGGYGVDFGILPGRQGPAEVMAPRPRFPSPASRGYAAGSAGAAAVMAAYWAYIEAMGSSDGTNVAADAQEEVDDAHENSASNESGSEPQICGPDDYKDICTRLYTRCVQEVWGGDWTCGQCQSYCTAETNQVWPFEHCSPDLPSDRRW